jgi:hypothetical protein
VFDLFLIQIPQFLSYFKVGITSLDLYVVSLLQIATAATDAEASTTVVLSYCNVIRWWCCAAVAAE